MNLFLSQKYFWDEKTTCYLVKKKKKRKLHGNYICGIVCHPGCNKVETSTRGFKNCTVSPHGASLVLGVCRLCYFHSFFTFHSCYWCFGFAVVRCLVASVAWEAVHRWNPVKVGNGERYSEMSRAHGHKSFEKTTGILSYFPFHVTYS